MLRANLLSVELGAELDEAGFAHRATSVTARLGASRIGAGVYEAIAGAPIWPYHYHHGVEEWLLVQSGSPVLREPAGRRVLGAGDVVAFPPGRAGAHTIEGPGRFVVFSARGRGGLLGVFPDSNKVSCAEGMLLRGPKPGYWHGEGTGDVDAVVGEREPLVLEGPPRPVVNLDAVSGEVVDAPEGFRARAAQLGSRLGAELLGATLYELGCGEGTAPYHYEYGREEWGVVLSGTPTLRHADGEDALGAGDVVCFPEGPTGAHRFINRSSAPARLVMLSTKDLPATVHYPDSGKWAIRHPPHGHSVILRADDAVGYWDGEAG